MKSLTSSIIIMLFCCPLFASTDREVDSTTQTTQAIRKLEDNQLVRVRLKRLADESYPIWIRKKDLNELKEKARDVDSVNIFTLQLPE